jgi:DNA transposition AAA+ family ATPase
MADEKEATKRGSPAEGEQWDGMTRAELLGWFKGQGAGLPALCGYTGRSKPALSQWFNGHYAGDSEAIGADLVRVKRLLEEKDRQPETVADHYVETSIAKEIWTLLRVARLDHDLAMIYSHPGRGKTTASREYAARYPGVAYIELDDTSNVRSLSRHLCEAFGVECDEWRLDKTLDRLVKALKGKDKQIIIDQAEFLLRTRPSGIINTRPLEFVRTIYDKAGASICLVCLPSFYETLRSKPKISAYILSRVGIRRQLGLPTDDDVRAWAEAHGIHDAGAIAELCKRKGAEGHLRTIRMAARKALRMASVNKVPVTASVVQEAFKYVFV